MPACCSRPEPTACCVSLIPLFPEAASAFAPVAMGLGRHRHHLRRRTGLCPDRPQAACGVYQCQPPGLCPARDLCLERSRASGRGDADDLPRPQHRARSSSWSGMLQERIHTRDMKQMGGLWATDASHWAASALFFALASLGLPGLGNFVGEFLVLLGTYQANPTAADLPRSVSSSPLSTRYGSCNAYSGARTTSGWLYRMPARVSWLSRQRLLPGWCGWVSIRRRCSIRQDRRYKSCSNMQPADALGLQQAPGDGTALVALEATAAGAAANAADGGAQ